MVLLVVFLGFLASLLDLLSNMMLLIKLFGLIDGDLDGLLCVLRNLVFLIQALELLDERYQDASYLLANGLTSKHHVIKNVLSQVLFILVRSVLTRWNQRRLIDYCRFHGRKPSRCQ